MVTLFGKEVGPGHPTFVVAEIGQNHNGSVDTALRLVQAAHEAGVSAVKFQKRTPEEAVPRDQWDVPKETPWGTLSYLDYRRRLELSVADFAEIDAYCKGIGMPWFVSCWDLPSLRLMRDTFNPGVWKVASASLTDHALLRALATLGEPVVLSTGMSTLAEIEAAVAILRGVPLVLLGCTSAYPCPPEELNVRQVESLRRLFPGVPVGWSGHEVGLAPTLAAVALGACVIERHITLDRSMWGTDQAASVEPAGLKRLIKDIRLIERVLGDGEKRVMPSEVAAMRKLRRYVNA